jgi:cell division protein ZapA
MSSRTEVTRVNIFGREYTIRGAGSPAYIAEIAHYVDMKMRQMTDNATMASTAKVAIFAALNIADELYQKRDQYQELEDSYSSELGHLADRVEQVLSETPQPAVSIESAGSDSSAVVKEEAPAIQQNSTSEITG